MSKIQLINNPNELGAGTRGSSMGFDALQIAALNKRSTFFKRYETNALSNYKDRLIDDSPYLNSKYIDGIQLIHKELSELISKTIQEKKFPFIISGDHSNAAGTIKGIKSAFPDKKLGAIWVDAHADLHTPFTSPSGNIHGMPLAIALGLQEEENAKNKISDAEKEQWNRLIGTAPGIQKEHLVFIGLRDTEIEEDDFIKNSSIKNISVTESRIQGFEKTCQDIFDYLQDIDLLYISFDVDSMDCNAVSYGTGTPVPGGFTRQESEKLLLQLIKHPKLCCFEITEINPCLDNKGNAMAENSMEIIEKLSRSLDELHA
ncbi:MAG: arginase [Bacteroidota bacterium]